MVSSLGTERDVLSGPGCWKHREAEFNKTNTLREGLSQYPLHRHIISNENNQSSKSTALENA